MYINLEPTVLQNAMVMAGFALAATSFISTIAHLIMAAPPADMEPCKALPRAFLSAVTFIATSAALLSRYGVEL